MYKRLLITLSVTLLLADPAAAENGPSFDCAKAASPVETAICGDPKLAALDRQVSRNYAAALKRLEPKGAESLREDQHYFLGGLGEGMKWNEGVEESKQIFNLQETLRERVVFLDAVGPAPRGHWVGTWSNHFGGIEITAKGGKLEIDANGAKPVTGNWVCQVGGQAIVEDDRLTLRGDSDGRGDDWTYRLTRDGDRIVFSQTGPQGETHGAPVCGHNGSMAGNYFYHLKPIKEERGAISPQRNP